MAQTVIALYDRFSDAQAAVQDLIDHGFSRDNISLIANNTNNEHSRYGDRTRAVGDRKMDDTAGEQAGSGALAGAGIGAGIGLLVGLGLLAIPGVGPVLAAGPLATSLGAGTAAVAGSTALGAGIGAVSGGLVGPLVDAGVPRGDAEVYNEGVRRGGTLVALRTDDNRANDAIDVMNDHNPADIDERNQRFRQNGWNGYNDKDRDYTRDDINRFRNERTTDRDTTMRTTDRDTTMRNKEGETVLPVVEEELKVGKRQVSSGGARVHTEVTERPVEEQVRLRDEHVDVERRKVDRPLSGADADAAFKERSYEMKETREEPVVSKEARVIEEVTLRKDVDTHTETVRGEVRRQDVEVDKTGPQTTNRRGFDAYDADFRKNYQSNYANSGYTYEQYQPVYRYGYALANDPTYRNREWKDVEPEARRRWEERNPNTWDRMKDSVRYAWDRARAKI